MQKLEEMSFSITLLLPALVSGCASLSHRGPGDGLRTTASVQSPMEYVSVCRAQGDCKKLSRIVMGTDHLAQANWTQEGQQQPSDSEVFAVLDEAARLGINVFDTSPIYVGDAENKLGRWMKSRRDAVLGDDFYSSPGLNPDRKLYALSKGGFPFDLFYTQKLEAGPHSAELEAALKQEGILPEGAVPLPDQPTPLTKVPPGTYASRLWGTEGQIEKRIAEELGHSRANLNDEITLYLMHRDDNDYLRFRKVSRKQTPVRRIMAALGAAALRDHYWMVGWSNWETSRVEDSLKIADETALSHRPIMSSPYFSLFEMGSRSIHAGGVQVTHENMIDPTFQKGILIMPYSPLGGFSILDQPAPQWENARRAAKLKRDQGDAYWQNVYPAIFTDDNRARWDRVVEFSKLFNDRHRTNYTYDQFINAYALAHNRTDLLAIGPITVEQLRRTVGALKLSKLLSSKDLEFLYRGSNRN